MGILLLRFSRPSVLSSAYHWPLGSKPIIMVGKQEHPNINNCIISNGYYYNTPSIYNTIHSTTLIYLLASTVLVWRNNHPPTLSYATLR